MGYFFESKGHVCPHIMSERGCARCGTSGFIAGTPILSNSGWDNVEYLRVGDMIPTLEHGLQPIIDIVREQIWLDPGKCPACILPLDIPAGAIGNAVPFILPIENAVALLSQRIEVTGIANVVIESVDMIGFSGITSVQPSGPTQISKLYFEHDEFIFVAHGAHILCRTEALNLSNDVYSAKTRTAKPGIPRLSHAQADAFLLLLEESA